MSNAITGEEKTVQWPVSIKSSDESVVDSLKLARKLAARPYLQTGPALVLRSWTKEVRPDSRPPGRELSMFSLLGGRAAIEETLQLQDLAVVARKKTSTVSMGSINGVTVKAHPFEQMLGDHPGGRLPLADTVPPDRFIVYAAQPTAILPLLEKGGGFVASIGAGLTGNQLYYNLVEKYLDRTGMNRLWIEAAIRSGLTKELIVSTPDLFFIDGTVSMQFEDAGLRSIVRWRLRESK